MFRENPRFSGWIITVITISCLTLLQSALPAQPVDYAELTNLVQVFKKDPRGPFQGIRWFCPDGSVIGPQERCSQPGGIQHALPKDVVRRVAEKHHIFLGQILAGTPQANFLDADNHYERMKQYQIESFLRAVDDGWIFRQARYYRGAYQAEDEEAWGLKFLSTTLANDELVREQFFLIRQAARDIPHRANDDRVNQIRALSKIIADSLSQFMDLRVKIHGNPDETDLTKVSQFRIRQKGKIKPNLDKKLEELENYMKVFYGESTLSNLARYRSSFPIQTQVGAQLYLILEHMQGSDRATDSRSNATNGAQIQSACDEMSGLLLLIRRNLTVEPDKARRMQMLDLSLDLERVLAQMSRRWQPETLADLFSKNYVLTRAAAGCGYLELWEWEYLEPLLLPVQANSRISLAALLERSDTARRAVDWAAAMFRAVYGHTVETFGKFEPLAHGFIDDRVRASILLPSGDLASWLAEYSAAQSGLANRVLNMETQNRWRGLNPGFALGELVVVTGSPDGLQLSADKIYAMQRAPADLKPVAGIATVSEGNTVSHVQLLARNLGIPNALLASESLTQLQRFQGQRVFYAVSPRGSVVMKLAADMTKEEMALVTARKRDETRINVPIDRINLKARKVIPLRDLGAKDSGAICGPKAANLGQLNTMFPGKVAPGLVIPFGIFREHMEQQMRGTNESYWHYLQETFRKAEQDRQKQVSEPEIESRILERLALLREAIQNMPLKPSFIIDLKDRFESEFKLPIGQLPVFIRSDTNMEDLKDFSGAGLNLTLPNVKKEEDLMRGIRLVWASPFTERSFRWRQKYLLNPENVYPSLLFLPSVNVDKSGVLITTGIVSGNRKDLTVAMNWGVAGAVDGQASESYLLAWDGRDVLLSPAREPDYTYLPVDGGVGKRFISFNNPLMTSGERLKIRMLAEEVRQVLPGTPGIETKGPFDVEFGFLGDHIWLFQVRPFVENKNARSSNYLNALDPVLKLAKKIALAQPVFPMN